LKDTVVLHTPLKSTVQGQMTFILQSQSIRISICSILISRELTSEINIYIVMLLTQLIPQLIQISRIIPELERIQLTSILHGQFTFILQGQFIHMYQFAL